MTLIICDLAQEAFAKLVIDPSSLYYLNTSNNPGSVLVPCVLIRNNYITWLEAMRHTLLAKNKLGFIDGSIEKLDLMAPKFNVWDIYNSMDFQFPWQEFRGKHSIYRGSKGNVRRAKGEQVTNLRSTRSKSRLGYHDKEDSWWWNIALNWRSYGMNSMTMIVSQNVLVLQTCEEEKGGEDPLVFYGPQCKTYGNVCRQKILNIDSLSILGKVYSLIM